MRALVPLSVLLLPALLAAPASAQAGIDAQAYQATREGLEARIGRERYRGVVAVVERAGERVFETALGVRDAAGEEPMRGDEIFRIFSMTKPLTAAAIMILVDEGRLSLDTPVATILPVFADMSVGVEDESAEGGLARVPLERPMLVLDLLRHTSGLTYGLFASSKVDELVLATAPLDIDRSLEDFVRLLASVPLKHQPGTRFEYSLSSDVLGRVVEVVAEQRFGAFLEERVLEPLGMIDSGFHVPADKLDRVAQLYVRAGFRLVPAQRHEAPDPGQPPVFESGGGGLYSTADDYLRFCQMLLAGGVAGDTRVLSESAVESMLTDQLDGMPAPMLQITGSGFGLGLAVRNRDAERGLNLGSVWWGGYAGTKFWIDPELDMCGVFMIQNLREPMHGNGFQSDIYRLHGR